MKSSFDGTTWYQLEWEDVTFREFDEVSKYCKDIEDLQKTIFESFPDSNLKYKFIGERKIRKKK